MRYIKLFKALCLLAAFVLLASCGGGTGGGAAGTSNITIAIGGTGQVAVIEQEEKTFFAKLFDFITPDEAIAGTDVPPEPDACDMPPDVHRIEFEIIEGIGIAPQQRTVFVNGRCFIEEEFTVRNGSGIIFKADEFNENGRHLYTGTAVQDISGADHVRIEMHDADGCDLYVDALNGNNPNNDCRNSRDRCETITYALTQTDGHETICVAEGDYWSRLEEGGRESYPLELLEGTTILCEGDQHGAVIHVGVEETGFQGGQIEGWHADGASIIGCTIMVEDDSTGIDDLGSDITVDDCIIDGWGAYNSLHGIHLRGNSTVKNSVIQNIGTFDTGIHITGGNPSILNNLITNNVVGIAVLNGDPVINNNTISCNWEFDLFIDNDENTPVNAQNNAWDNFPDIFIEESPCSHNGTDICVSSGEIPVTTGGTLAADGCRNVPEPECYTDSDCFAGMICVDGLCTIQQTCVPTLLTPEPGTLMDNAGPNCEDPLNWNFTWSECPEATGYQIRVFEPFTSGPYLIDNTSIPSYAHSTSTPATVASGWTWGVRAIFDSLFSEWSQPGTFDVEDENRDCHAEPICGDGNLDPGEECDDGNTFDGDGCSANCTVECVDVSGDWTLFVSNINSTCGSEPSWSSDITIFQTGCNLEAVGIKGSTFPVSGSIVGNAGTIGPASFPEDFGTTTATYSGTLQPDGTITGSESWTWVGEGSCTGGTADIILRRRVETGCTRHVAVLNADGSVASDAGNDCMTASTPCRSITHAMFEIDQGALSRAAEEVICVGAGPYNNQTGEVFPILFLSTDSFEGQGHDNTTIRCEGPDHSSIIDSSGFSNSLVTPGHGFPITTTVEGCRFTTQFSLSAIESSGNNMFITNNIIDSGFCSGIQIAGGNSTISGNTIHNLSGGDCTQHVGIEILGGGSSPLGVISNNTISGNDMGIVANLTNSLDSLLISQNNIYCNSNYGLLHVADFGATIDAQNNAWNNDGPRVDDHNITGCPPSGQFTDICHYEATSPVLYTPWNAPDPLACPFLD